MRKIILTITLSTLLLAACKSTPYIQKKEYVLITEKPVAEKTAYPLTIGVTNTVANGLYQNNEFIYRLKGGKLTHDYYNTFATSPGQIISNSTTQWLTRTNVFSSVLTSDLGLNTDYTLKSKLITLVANYSNAKIPKADIQIEYLLIDKQSNIILDKRYSAHQPLLHKTTEALVDAWNEGLSDILGNLIKDIKESIEDNKNFVIQYPEKIEDVSDATDTTPKKKSIWVARATEQENTAAQSYLQLGS